MAPSTPARPRESGDPEQLVLDSRFRGNERKKESRGRPFPWPQALAVGLGVLRLPPEQFWRMTPRELAAALRGLHGDASTPLDRAAFDALRARFPDTPSSFETPSLRDGSSG